MYIFPVLLRRNGEALKRNGARTRAWRRKKDVPGNSLGITISQAWGAPRSRAVPPKCLKILTIYIHVIDKRVSSHFCKLHRISIGFINSGDGGIAKRLLVKRRTVEPVSPREPGTIRGFLCPRDTRSISRVRLLDSGSSVDTLDSLRFVILQFVLSIVVYVDSVVDFVYN